MNVNRDTVNYFSLIMWIDRFEIFESNISDRDQRISRGQ